MERQVQPVPQRSWWRLLPGRRPTLLASLFGRYVWALPLIAVLGLAASILESIGIGLLIPLSAILLDNAFEGLPAPFMAVVDMTSGLDQRGRVLLLCAILVSFILLKGVVHTVNNIFIATLVGWIGRDLRSALGARLLELDYPFFLRHDSARLTHILSTDAWLVLDAARVWLALIPASVALLVTSAILAWLSFPLFLIVLVGGFLIQMVLLVLERRQGRLSAEVTASDLAFWNRILVLIRAARVIRVFGQQEREKGHFVERIDRMRRAVLHSQRQSAIVAPALDGLLVLLFVVVLVAGYWTGMSIPATIAFLVLLMRAQPYAHVLSLSRLSIASVREAIGEVEWLLAQRRDPAHRLSGTPAPAIDQPIHFDNVTFAYPDGRLALHAASFTIRPGKSTALIGRSGAGKTTVVNLLARLQEPQAGTIRAGDLPVDSFDRDSWRSRIAIAGQDMDLVDGTIAENIGYARPDASFAEIVEVARTAGATEFIERLPQGYDTEVGEEGIKLSGGQRQRISLARALLQRPDLLILDEAMNAVDALSETEIMKLLTEHRDFRTALVISHRISTLAACDEGIVIEDGRIRETGPLASLTYFRDMAGRVSDS